MSTKGSEQIHGLNSFFYGSAERRRSGLFMQMTTLTVLVGSSEYLHTDIYT